MTAELLKKTPLHNTAGRTRWRLGMRWRRGGNDLPVSLFPAPRSLRVGLLRHIHTGKRERPQVGRKRGRRVFAPVGRENATAGEKTG